LLNPEIKLPAAKLYLGAGKVPAKKQEP